MDKIATARAPQGMQFIAPAAPFSRGRLGLTLALGVPGWLRVVG
jgi:hypothetical protein